LLDAALVIVNFRSPDLVERCLAAVGDAVGERVVVDNASGDGSVERLRAAGVEVVARAANDGFAAGVNAGFAATRAPVVIVLNPDTEPRPRALARLVRRLEAQPRLGVTAPRLVFPDGRAQPSAYKRFPGLGILFLELCTPLGYLLVHLPWLDPYRGTPAAHVLGAALAIRRAAYADAGPLDEGFFLYLEETEWQARLRARGWGVELVEDAEVVHLVRGGGAAADAPSAHFVRSARRYLRLRGHRDPVVRAVLGAALWSSVVFLRAIGRRERAAAYRRLTAELRG
jgi:GT2 family glycosyltransferase